jgi:hypothetical protein
VMGLKMDSNPIYTFCLGALVATGWVMIVVSGFVLERLDKIIKLLEAAK